MKTFVERYWSWFNLGVTYYKLKRISEAKEAILQARDAAAISPRIVLQSQLQSLFTGHIQLQARGRRSRRRPSCHRSDASGAAPLLRSGLHQRLFNFEACGVRVGDVVGDDVQLPPKRHLAR